MNKIIQLLNFYEGTLAKISGKTYYTQDQQMNDKSAEFAGVAHSGSYIIAKTNSVIIAKEDSIVLAESDSIVIALNGSCVFAKGGSKVIAFSGARIFRDETAIISAEEHVKVFAMRFDTFGDEVSIYNEEV